MKITTKFIQKYCFHLPVIFFSLFYQSALFSDQTISEGYQHRLFLKEDGSLWAMGANSYGQLGDGTNTDKNSSSLEIESIGIIAVSASGDLNSAHSLFIKTDGSLWAMGYNVSGQLGDGTNTDQNTPKEILSSGVEKISAGRSHSLFIKDDGSLWSMGYNNYGQLGDGTQVNKASPVQIESDSVSEVSAGAYHTLYIKTDGSLWSMGYNNFGQLGDGTGSSQNSSVQIENSGVIAVAAGSYHSLYLKADGSLWVMGANGYGQFGNGTSIDSNDSIQVESGGVSSIAAGGNHSFYVKDDGSLWAMGRNSDGQLGDGTTTDRSSPVEIESGGVTAVSAGYSNTIYKKTDGSLWGMGSRWGSTPVEIESSASMNPKLLSSNTSVGGAVLGTGKYNFNSTTSLAAIPDDGFIFAGWSGDSNSTDDNITFVMTSNFEANATFYQLAALNHVQNNPSNYNLFTEAEKNASDASSYATGLSDGNSSGIQWVQNNPNSYNLYTESEKNASDLENYSNGKAHVQAVLAEQGLANLQYLQDVDLGRPYTSQWFYQPGIGWLWTSREAFPFIYRAQENESGMDAGWLFLNQSSVQSKIYLYDYGSDTWLEQDF